MSCVLIVIVVLEGVCLVFSAEESENSRDQIALHNEGL